MKTEIKETLKPRIEKLRPKEVPTDFADDNGKWMVTMARQHLGKEGIAYALIHADDGVMWRKVEGDQFDIPAQNEWTPPMRSKTIQQCRVFGNRGELFIWREAEDQRRGRVVIDEEGEGHSFEETQILYGSRVDNSQKLPEGFTAIFEPTTGIRQIVPIEFDELEDNMRVTVTVVNYLSSDEDGQARIFCSRLKAINPPANV